MYQEIICCALSGNVDVSHIDHEKFLFSTAFLGKQTIKPVDHLHFVCASTNCTCHEYEETLDNKHIYNKIS